MDLAKLIGLAASLDVPGGIKIARDAAAFAAMVKVNADRAHDVLTDGDRAALDAIHLEALAAADLLDAKLAAAERR